MSHPSPPPMQGVISAHPRGFGFVEQDSGDAYFVPPPQMRTLVPGDLVCFSLAATPQRQQFSAVIHEVLKRPESFWLGQAEQVEGGLRLRPDEACTVSIRLDATPGVDAADVIQIRVPEDQDLGQPAVHGSLVANLGPRGARDFDVRYAIAKWRLPVEFGEAALAQAHGCQEPSIEQAAEMGFADLTQLPFVTIDNESTRDFDDALCLVDNGSHWTLHVAIAHVSHYVPPGSPVDLEARMRATSVYLPGRTLPMLPPELSNGLCSLNPEALRYAVVCSLKYSKQGGLSGYGFCEAVVRSAARLSYRQVAAGGLPPAVEPMLQGLWQWFETQQPARAQRGLFEYRDREPRLVVRPDGAYDIDWVPLERSNELVEEAMLAANRAAAAHLTLLGAGLLFRHQEGLDGQKWQDIRTWLATQGLSAPPVPTLADLRTLLGSTQDHRLRPQIEFRIRRAMTPAVYDERQSSHFSLGFLTYTHFTSPIRRYPDLLVHRMLLGQATEVDAELSDHLSARAKAARQASRHPWERLKRRLVWQSGEHEHEAQLVSRSARGLRAALAQWDVLAAIDAAMLESQGWTWDPTRELWCREDAELDLGSVLKLRLLDLKDEGPTCELSAQLIL